MTHHDDKDWEFGPVFKSNISIVCTAMILIEVGWAAMLYQGLPRPIWPDAPIVSMDPCSHATSKDGSEFISRPCAIKAGIPVSEKSEARDSQGALYQMLPPCPGGNNCVNATVEAVPVPNHKENSRRGLYMPDGSLHIEGTGIVCFGYVNGQTQCSVPVGSVAYSALGSAVVMMALTSGVVSSNLLTSP